MGQPSWKKQLPMIATSSRMAFAPILIIVLYIDLWWSGWTAAIVFIIASLTDWLDGYWARKYQAESPMGKLMDPIADKILVLGPLIMLLDLNRVDPFMVLILLTRDIFIGGLRSVAAANQVVIAAKPFGKWKTAFQMTAIPCILIYHPIFNLPIYEIGYYGLWVSALLSLISGVQYTHGYYRARKEN